MTDPGPCGRRKLGLFLERAYADFNSPDFIGPDPLGPVRACASVADRELAALVSASLALGSAPLITRAASDVMQRLGRARGKAPGSSGAGGIADVLDTLPERAIDGALAGFKYRFFDGGDLSSLLVAAKRARSVHGSLLRLFLSGDDASATVARGATAFVAALEGMAPSPWKPNLLPSPGRGSACKRLFLMFRWLVRSDAVDPGGWEAVGRERLVVPLDTHMARACRTLGMLKRAGNSLAAALEATAEFRRFRPDDPVRYDFCLTRPGLHPDLDAGEYFRPFAGRPEA
ncbi:MAG: TIGR02757 family protein [Spirochaetes bacterium]|nr:TIGR02757 family protein [Spirochaetota bacterium]